MCVCVLEQGTVQVSAFKSKHSTVCAYTKIYSTRGFNQHNVARDDDDDDRSNKKKNSN